jgi:uncharacterized protein (DUF427 family)
MPTDADTPITMEPARRRWRAEFAGHVIADTDNALIVREPGNPQRVYFPREDVATEYMGQSDRSAFDPAKGTATYYTLMMDGNFAENGVWAYESPQSGFEALAGRIAFLTDKVDVYDIDDPEMAAHPRTVEGVGRTDVDEVVQHTDSGAGRSQSEPWEPTKEANFDDGGLN